MLYCSDLQQVDYNNHPYDTDANGLMRVLGGMVVILAASKVIESLEIQGIK